MKTWCLCAVALLAVAACAPTQGEDDLPVVIASFYPLEFVAQEVGGGDLVIEGLTPPGAEPHDLELTPGQVRALVDADLIVYLGGGFQPALEDALTETDAPTLDVMEHQDELLEAPEPADEEGQEEEGSADPHIWLDPNRLAVIADAIADQLAVVDPDNADIFVDNARELEDRLAKLDAEFRDGLSNCERSSFVTSHEAFGYLADAYGLEEIGIAGIDPEAEPSPRRLAEVAEFARANGVTTIFFEVLVSPRVAEALASEVGVETARLDPLEGPPNSGDYFDGMRSNLDSLRQALGCR